MTAVFNPTIHPCSTLGVAGALLLLLTPQSLHAQEAGSAEAETLTSGVVVDRRDLKRKGSRLTSYADVLEGAKSSVVRVFTEKLLRPHPSSPFASDPLFERIFRGSSSRATQPQQSKTGLGSGIIITRDGYILTNSHVIDGADKIQVEIPGERHRHNAAIVGSDPESDVAVIKIERGKTSFPAAVLADSSKSRVGDVVFAIGSPFDYPQTISMGIVSALGRTDVNIIGERIGSVGYENFIQTDASINPGNSGGALVDAQGRVIGVNTAIASDTRGNLGIGFAIPINMALRIATGIVDTGEVQRGYLGIEMQEVTEPLAEKLGAPDASGVLVRIVQPGSPAAIAGLQPLDVIVRCGSQKVDDVPRLRLQIAATDPGETVAFRLLRSGASLDIPVTLARKTSAGFELVGDPDIAIGNVGNDPAEGQPRHGRLAAGIEVEELTDAARSALGIEPDRVGMLVTGVDPASEAARAGLSRGDLIAEVEEQTVATLVEAQRRFQSAGRIVVIRIFSGSNDRYVALRLQ